MRKYKLRCELLSPIHIGTGHEIDPFDYIIGGSRLYRISFEKFVAAMSASERGRFEAILNEGNLVEVRKYVAGNVDEKRDSIYSIKVSNVVEKLYMSKLDDVYNQLLIYPFLRAEGPYVPLIPGSSIKGALRTAIISDIANQSNLPRPKDTKEEYQFESKVLGYKDGKNDPFRGMRIRDAFLGEDDTIVREVKNVSKGRKPGLQFNDIQIICEVSNSSISGRTVEFETTIYFDEELFATKYLSKTLNIEQLIKSCNTFYEAKMEYEHKKFYQTSQVENFSTQLLNTKLDERSFVIRLGRFSGVESVTLDNYRNPKPPGGKGVWGTSRNLAEGLYPMGWVKVKVSD